MISSIILTCVGIVCVCLAGTDAVPRHSENFAELSRQKRGFFWPDAKPAAAPPADNKDLKGVTCPGVGRFAVKKQDEKNCQKYYECPIAFQGPSSLVTCPEKQKFNRLSRTCVPKEQGNCKWCSKEGRHADKTSNKHFIECVAGSIAIRYRCKDGKYDAQKKSCKKTALKDVMDVMIDAMHDHPQNILQYMKDWKDAEDEEKEEKKTVSKSIEEGAAAASAAAEEGEGEEKDEAEAEEEVVDKKKKTKTAAKKPKKEAEEEEES